MTSKNSIENKGISRSGRVRKRSSKFNDYESSEELEPKKKMTPKQGFKQMKMDEEDSSSSSSSTSSSSSSDSDDSDIDIKDESLEYLDEWNENVNPEQLLEIKNEGYDDFQSDSQSLYFSEKRKPSLDQVVKRRKAERKDKGQSRLTAYMIWAKATRPTILESNPNMDFPQINRRLGEMWALVPPVQKMNWKRKARLLLARKQKEKKKVLISTGNVTAKKARPDKPNTGTKGKLQQYYRTIPVPAPTNTQIMSKHRTQKVIARTTITPNVNDAVSNTSLSSKVTGTSPHDVAAHLKLLGESLNNIGQKLKEHEDQIAVSGSLSVLLDSMLCVLGPLACLTNQLDETRGAIPEETLTGILDNIAYIMPGIA